MPAADELVGTVLAGRFHVERVVGEGGMGVVLLARHLELDERVAVKMLSDAATPSALERFRREARAAARLRNEHVAHVKDFLVLDDGRPLLVMEYVSGRPLSAELAERGPLPSKEAVGIVLGAAEGLAEAHAIGIVHRDVKPSNLMLTRRPDGTRFVKILDFGVARRSLDLETLTQDGEALIGSPPYMSPEQIMSPRTVDARTDVWSLGVTLYQLLAGDLPFKAYSTTGVLKAVVDDEAPPLSTVRPGLPRGLAEVVARCLSKQPSARYGGVDTLAEALAPFADAADAAVAQSIARVLRARPELYRTERIDGPIVPDGETRTKGAGLATSMTRAEPEPSVQWRPATLVGGAIGAMLVGASAVGVWSVLRAPRPAPPPVTAPPVFASEAPPAATATAQATAESSRSAAPPVSAAATSSRARPPSVAVAAPPVATTTTAPPAAKGPLPAKVDPTDFGGR